MNMLRKFIAAGAFGSTALCVQAQAQPFSFPTLNMEEQETLRTFQARNECIEDHEPVAQREREEYNSLRDIRESYIRARAQELARQRSEASEHIIISGALTEKLTTQEAEQLVQTMRRKDEESLRSELNRLVKQPEQPQSTDEYCAVKLNIDTNNFGRRVRALTEKHGKGILQMPEIK